MPIDVSKMTLPEIFKHIDELPLNKKAQALTTIANYRKEIKDLLYCTFRNDVKFNLPEGNPPYNPLEIPANMGLDRLSKEMRMFEYFIKPNSINQIKREKMFIEMLESVTPDEAKLILMVKNKKLSDYKSITRKLAEKSIPEIFAGEK
jgi:hypothetical protein